MRSSDDPFALMVTAVRDVRDGGGDGQGFCDSARTAVPDRPCFGNLARACGMDADLPEMYAVGHGPSDAVNRRLAALAGLAVAGIAARPLLDRRVAQVEARLNGLFAAAPYRASEAAAALHRTLTVADLHADSLLWGRDLLARGARGHVDLPRLLEGNVALQVLAASTKVPRHASMDRNDDRSDDVLFLALAQRWPPPTWFSLLERALHLARRLHHYAGRSEGRLRVLTSRRDLDRLLADRAAGMPLVGGLLAVEGAHALDGDPANVDVLVDAGYRMMSPSHLFDSPFGGSAHGVAKAGLTEIGREMIARMDQRSMIVDLAHASAATIADVLAVATRPVIASHTGVCGTCDHVRNLTDDQLRGIAATGGVVGIGFWETATGGRDAAAIARAIRHAVDVIGPRHVALGSDWDGAVAVPFDASGPVLLTEALLAAGLAEQTIHDVMGGNVVRLLEASLPEA